MGRGTHIGEFEELVLLAVLRLGTGAHGSEIRRELKDRAGRSVSVSTIYVALMRLEEKGFARSWKGEASPRRGGKARRQYELTPEGVEALRTRRATRDRMWAGLDGDAEPLDA